jgi:hypothetical protein
VRGSTQASTLGDKPGRALCGQSLDDWRMQLACCESSHWRPASPGAYRYAGERTLECFGPSALRTLLSCSLLLPCAAPPLSAPPSPPSSLSLGAPPLAKMHRQQISAQSEPCSCPASWWLIWRSIVTLNSPERTPFTTPSRFPTKKKARVRELLNLTICHSRKRMRPPLESSNRVAMVAR